MSLLHSPRIGTTRLWHSNRSELHWVRLVHNKEFAHPEWIEVSVNPWPSRALDASGCFPNNKKSSTITANHQKRSGKPFQTAASIVCGFYRPQEKPKFSPRPLTGERRTSAPKVITTPVPRPAKNPSYAFDMPARFVLSFRRRCDFLNDFRCSGKQRFRAFQRA